MLEYVVAGCLCGAAVIAASAASPSSESSAGSSGEAAPAVTDAGWPQWRGPARDGHSPGPAWPERLRPERITESWHVTDLGPSYASPIVTSSHVFSVETRDEAEEVVRAYDRATGAPRWETSWKGAMKVPFFANRNGSWIRSTPATDGQRLYVGGMRDRVVCLDVESGSVVWDVDCMSRYDTPMPAFGLVCSPLVTAEHLYVQAGGAVLKLDKRTGQTVWRSLAGDRGMDSPFSSPVLTTLVGREQLVVQTRQELCGVDPADGEVLWKTPIKAFRGMNILTPLVFGDSVFTAAHSGRAQLMNVERQDDGLAVSRAWSLPIQGYMTSPVVVDDHAYFFTRSNRFVCVDLAEGKQRWTSGPTGDSYWSLVARGDRILALNDTGRLRLIRPNPEAYEVIDEMGVIDDQTWAHLAVAGNEVFVRAQTGLLALRWAETLPEAP